MKFTVSKTFAFEAAHSLPGLPEGHKCRNLHGHSYVFEVFCTGPLDERGFVIDYAEISAAVDPLVAMLDHKNINEVLFIPTTAENLGAWLFDRIAKALPLLDRVCVYETAKTCVRVEK